MHVCGRRAACHLYITILINILDATRSMQLTISTYNLWNIMFNWDVRKLRIAQLIKQNGPDIVAFQEVRADRHSTRNQVTELQQLLPLYQWIAFQTANDIIPLKDVYMTGWEKEGIGLLSKLPVINQTSFNLKYWQGPDRNRRLVLHAVIDDQSPAMLNVLVVHFSYDRQQQCANAVDIQNYIEANHLHKVIILGDLNTYADYEWPVDILIGDTYNPENLCSALTKQHHLLHRNMSFIDSWKYVHSDSQGFSFSNMPSPGLESRPDRIIISTNLQPVKAALSGDGRIYREKFSYHIWWNRLENILSAMMAAQNGISGRACQYDCGPHASCRCGVCVAGDGHACLLPDCDECSATMFSWLTLLIGVTIMLVCQLIYALLRVMHLMNHQNRQRLATFMGAHCCLCNPNLYKPFPYHYHRRPIYKLIYCRRLPPMVLVFVTLLALFLLTELILVILGDAIADIDDIIPEELYPSDHLMLTVGIIT